MEMTANFVGGAVRVPATVNGRPAGLSASTCGESTVALCSSRSLAQAPALARRRKAAAASVQRVRWTLFMAS
jgi:hypothetical protein